jgi:phosphate starvation-inducible PhoH-like protein
LVQNSNFNIKLQLLNERIIELIDIAPKEFWGAQDTHLEMIKNIIQIKSCQRNNFKSFGEKKF